MAHWITGFHIFDEDDSELFFECSACGCERRTNSRFCPDCGEKMENGVKIKA